METTRHISVGYLLVLLISCMSPIMADFNAVKNSCSKPCQLTVDACKKDFQENHPDRTDNCVLLTSSIDGISAFKCLVRNGFCTEHEFTLLKVEACGVNKQTVSVATSALYHELNLASLACQRGAINCTKASSVATVLKQQEYYCDLINIQSDVTNSGACLTNSGCSQAEIDRIKAAACKYSPKKESQFAKAVMNTSPACKVAMDTCSASSLNFFEGIQREEYCLALIYDGRPEATESCLVGKSKCTQSEFDNLRDAACGVVPGYNSLSKICQKSVYYCKCKALFLSPESTDTCAFLESTIKDETAYDCLVIKGSCTESEFNQMKNDACDLNKIQPNVPSAKTEL